MMRLIRASRGCAFPDTSISGCRVARELTALIERCDKPGVVVSDNGTELTSNAVLRWCAEHGVNRLAFLPRDRYGRSAAQVQHALANGLLLGATERFLGSSWSSFSELALRLSQRIARAEFSGQDF